MKISTKKQASCDEKRRSFLKLSGLLGLGVATTALLPIEQAEAVLFGKKEYKVSRTGLAMGTYVSMTAIHSSRDEAENAIGLAFEEMDRLSRILSRYDSSSPVSDLNSAGYLKAAPQEILELVAQCDDNDPQPCDLYNPAAIKYPYAANVYLRYRVFSETY